MHDGNGRLSDGMKQAKADDECNDNVERVDHLAPQGSGRPQWAGHDKRMRPVASGFKRKIWGNRQPARLEDGAKPTRGGMQTRGPRGAGDRRGQHAKILAVRIGFSDRPVKDLEAVMPRGGYKPGGGRPRGSKSDAFRDLPADIQSAAFKSGLSPLDFLLSVMCDDEQALDVRIRVAGLALPYVHPKPAEVMKGKKEAAEAAAETAGHGTEWGDDLAAPVN